MVGFADAPLIGPGSELQLTSDGDVVPHPDVVAAAVLEPAEDVTAAAVLEELGAGEKAEALELELALAPAGARSAISCATSER